MMVMHAGFDRHYLFRGLQRSKFDFGVLVQSPVATGMSSGAIQRSRPSRQTAIGFPACLCRTSASRTASASACLIKPINAGARPGDGRRRVNQPSCHSFKALAE
jgi:hypothetical protein